VANAVEPQTPRYPVRLVSLRTGLSAHVLRAWERRYRVVTPTRSDGGQRLYSDLDIERLLRLRRLTDRGHSIGRIASLPLAELDRLEEEPAGDGERAGSPTGQRGGPEARPESVNDLIGTALQAMRRLNGIELQAVLERAPLARLLLGETSPVALSPGEEADVLKHHFSYLADDLAVVDWNCAFVLEPSGVTDIPDLLEFATAHLLELRYYDALLDRELAAIYDEMEASRRLPALFTRRYARLQRRTAALLLELSEMVERLENGVKIVGDFYLARLYQAAVGRFRLPAWQGDVLRKQRLLADVNRLLNDAADVRRGELLEVTIILLILWEILWAVLR